MGCLGRLAGGEVMKLPLIAVVLGLSACAPSLQTVENADQVRLTGSLGTGDLFASAHAYEKMLASGKRIIWDGAMVSGDAFFAPAVVDRSGGCYTENASWHPHAASYFGIIPEYVIPGDDYMEGWLIPLLPDKMGEAFSSSWHRWDPITIPSYTVADLYDLWPEGACLQEAAR